MGGTLSLMLAAAMKRAGLNRKVMAVSRFSSMKSRELLESRDRFVLQAHRVERLRYVVAVSPLHRTAP